MYSSIGRETARLAPELGLSLTIGDEFYTRSDHYNFARKGIPVVFFCDGEHEDYHQVTDTADRLELQKMLRVARLAHWTGWKVANAEARPELLGRQQGW
jgi:Zn-dependent M28 family amino/carboxypeptidase